MNITQTSSKNRAPASKAVIGGGVITTPAVAAHVRRKMPDADLHASRLPAPNRQAIIGGGVITTPAVAAHVRQKVTSTNQR